MLIVKTIVYDCFTLFPEFVYIFLYTAIYTSGISILNIGIFMFSKGRSEKVFKNILKKVFGKTNCFFLGFFYNLIYFADFIDFFVIGIMFFLFLFMLEVARYPV